MSLQPDPSPQIPHPLRAVRALAIPNPIRRRLQYPALAGTALVLGAIAVWPAIMLPVVWNVVVPLLPASFIVSPHLWRAVCPLATAGSLTNGLVARRAFTPEGARRCTRIGLLLLILLIPFRHLLLNQNPTALIGAIGLLIGAAAAFGAVYDVKAGFCNAFCPILPVERLYGQQPLVGVGEVRCLPCTACTRHGCLDLGTGAIGTSRGTFRPRDWILHPTGIFLGAFPGLIIAYGMSGDVPLSMAGTVYLHAGEAMLLSWMVLSLLALGLNLTLSSAAAAGAALALSLYYWFAAPRTAETIGLGTPAVWGIRVVGLLLAGFWWWKRQRSITPLG